MRGERSDYIGEHRKKKEGGGWERDVGLLMPAVLDATASYQ